MTDVALASRITKPPAAMIFIKWDKWVLVFYVESFEMAVKSQYKEIIENACVFGHLGICLNAISIKIEKISLNKVLLKIAEK